MSEEKDIHTKEWRKFSQERVNGNFLYSDTKIGYVFIQKLGGNIRDIEDL